MIVLVFDTETTGLPETKIINPDTLNLWPNIVQLSYIVYDVSKNKILNVVDSIVKLDEKNIIYYKLFINQELSERQILFRSSDFCRDVNAAISNYSVYFDFVSKRLKMIFMLTSNNVNNIFYTEFDYSSGVLNNPSIC